MELMVDSQRVEIEPGQTIYDAVVKLGLESPLLSQRPLAAQIGGDVYNLRYTPHRDTQLHLLRYQEDMGRRVYEYTAQFVLLLACRRLFPGARVRVCYALDAGVYITLEKQPALSRSEVRRLEEECRRIAELDLPLVRRRMDIKEAVEFFERDGQLDKARLLKWRRFSYFDVYSAQGEATDYKDYFYGEMAPREMRVQKRRPEKPAGGTLSW